MGTKKGTVKKTDIKEFLIQRSNGKKAIRLNEGDELIEAKITNGDNDIVLATRHGLSIRFNEQDVRSMGRTAAGVRGVRLAKGNEVVTMDVVEPGTTLLSITSKGIGKRTPIDDYRLQSRGGKGIITIKTSGENGEVVGVLKVDETDEAMLITSGGQAIRIPVNGISIIGRNTKGVRLFRVSKGEQVVCVTKIIEPEEKIEEDIDDKKAITADKNKEESADKTSDGKEQDEAE
jgi:DNA gyrase subunit A